MSERKRDRESPIKIRVDRKAKAVIRDLADRYGMKQEAVASRVYLWFSKQDDEIQRAILSMYPPTMDQEIARMLLERIASARAKDG